MLNRALSLAASANLRQEGHALISKLFDYNRGIELFTEPVIKLMTYFADNKAKNAKVYQLYPNNISMA